MRLIRAAFFAVRRAFFLPSGANIYFTFRHQTKFALSVFKLSRIQCHCMLFMHIDVRRCTLRNSAPLMESNKSSCHRIRLTLLCNCELLVQSIVPSCLYFFPSALAALHFSTSNTIFCRLSLRLAFIRCHIQWNGAFVGCVSAQHTQMSHHFNGADNNNTQINSNMHETFRAAHIGRR